ncbi:MAG: ChaN family lipoprotein [Magnetococcales bacterium]|nr:ChaN family lipoprotein [Magnetococcales bacterium]
MALALLGGVWALLAACGTIPATSPGGEWERLAAEARIAHADGQLLSANALLEKMLDAQVIYLGEQHDNPYHHRLQLAIVEQLIARGKRPVIGFEFFSQAQTGWLMHYTVGKPSAFVLPKATDPGERLRAQLGWETREDWSHYFPLIQLARQHKLSVFGADLPDGLRVRLTRGGLADLSPIEKASWSPTGFVNEPYRLLMRQHLASSHCGMAPDALLDRLYETWVARNDAMARAITLVHAQQTDAPVVMVLGAGHVAHDMGVYERVASLQPAIRQLNLGLQSTLPDDPPLSRYFATVRVGQTEFAPEHPYLWFTPPPPRDEDPCALLMPQPSASHTPLHERKGAQP